ncbi:TIGR03826 family flagellar region protein [Tepidibacillus infernus]|uniref:Flagellar protein n=1 Tax=Tepidibacillus decaturensis TaxID=1413211 RepID=A0A135L6F3_9BACI|nr:MULTISPECIES: TIGR03826 family flagellar region protein [Tepidibacillus]KXG44477.1 flagellar protein [Tepidibacillus decaturensis]GBF10533.1 hypothetical protein HK1_00545 [Tepidibacillus sp. HK-1]
MVGKLSNCPRCGKLYVAGVKEVCPACEKEIDQEYQRCADYLREHKGANIYELSEATEVTIKQITKFIREGRISIADAPNMGYPCESCGTIIQEGRLCNQCRGRLEHGIKHVLEQEAEEKNKDKGLGYYNKGKLK